jgi:diguanylate cyclase (GGDEF)-like protein
LGYTIEEERTRGEHVAPTYDRRNEDISLLVLRGPDMGRRFLVKPPGGVMGREEGAAVQTRDTTISRRAALIEFNDAGRVLVTDLGSKNGVFIDGVQISRAEIYDGNHIQLSNDTVMRVRFQDPVETELLEELQVAAMRDPLTGLPNRRYLRHRLEQEMAWSRRKRDPLSLALLDVDDFKKVIDADGQKASDDLFRTIAGMTRAATRQEDVVARYGADELVVVMRGTDSDKARHTTERLRAAIGKRVFDVGDVPIKATVSAGVVTYLGLPLDEPAEEPPAKASKKKATKKGPPRPKKKAAAPVVDRAEVLAPITEQHVTELLAQADAALFKAKEAGKDCVALWEETKS